MFGGIGLADDKEAKRIERRRKDEEERRARLLSDPRTLKMAVDSDALTEQIRQKKEAKEAEKRREMEEAAAIKNSVSYLETLDAQKERERRENAIAIMNYNRTASDLSTLQTSFPKAVVPAPLPENGGLSGLRTLQGEDPLHSERARRQQQQLKEWAAQQLAEKEERKRQELEQQRLYEQRVSQMDQTIFQLEQQQFAAKQAQLLADREFNKQLAEQKKEKEVQRKLSETFNNMEEINYLNTSNFLTENMATQIRADSPNRVVPYAYKGLTPEQQQAIREEQARQIRLKEEKRQRELEEQRRWEQAQMQQAALLAERERIVAQQQREALQRLQEENLERARQQKERNAQRNIQSKTNQPSEAYFSQFGTSSR